MTPSAFRARVLRHRVLVSKVSAGVTCPLSKSGCFVLLSFDTVLVFRVHVFVTHVVCTMLAPGWGSFLFIPLTGSSWQLELGWSAVSKGPCGGQGPEGFVLFPGRSGPALWLTSGGHFAFSSV